MLSLHVLCVSLSNRNKPFASLSPSGYCHFWCLLFFAFILSENWSLSSPSLPSSSANFRPLSPLVKSVTSATLFCPSLGTLASAGQWILMSSLRTHSVKARRRDVYVLRLHCRSQSDTLTSAFSPLSLPFSSSATQVKDWDNCQVAQKIIRQFCWQGQRFTSVSLQAYKNSERRVHLWLEFDFNSTALAYFCYEMLCWCDGCK